MKLATTTADFDRKGVSRADSLPFLHEAGFRYVDLHMYHVHPDDPLLLREDWHTELDRLKATADSLGMTFVQAHSPSGNAFDESKLDSLLATTIRSIEVCGALGIPNIVVHAGCEMEKATPIGKEEFYERNRDFYRSLFPAMEKYNVNVLVENGTRVISGRRYFFYTGADMREFIEYIDHPLFHACWDTGHANCEGGQYEHLRALGEHLYAVHINDNRGERDEHLIPYMGTLNMDDVMHGLLDANYKGYFTFEAINPLRPTRYWLGNRRSYEKDNRLSEPTLFMKQELEHLMYRIGEHILNAYNCLDT